MVSPQSSLVGWKVGIHPGGRAPKCGDTMGKTVRDMARLSWSALPEQDHVQMVSPYFTTSGQPTRNSPAGELQPLAGSPSQLLH